MNLLRTTTAVVVAAGLVWGTGCGDDDPMMTDTDSGMEPSDGGGLDAGTGSDGGPLTMDVTLDFGAMVGTETFDCTTEYTAIGSEDATILVKDFRFFVSNVRLIDDEDNEVQLVMDMDDPDTTDVNEEPWQHCDDDAGCVALLDFENGETGSCGEAGNADTNTTIRGTITTGTYTGVAFDIGVPFELNHLDTGTAPSPLNVTAMFWNWQGGHKFARIDIRHKVDESTMTPWNFHLGSTGCESAGSAVAPTVECTEPNRLPYVFDTFDWQTDTLVMDVATLLDGVDVTTNTTETPPGCMSFRPDVNECAVLFPNIGLSWDTGECTTDCADQKLIRVVTPG